MEALVLAHAKARVRRAIEQLWLVLLFGWSVNCVRLCGPVARSLIVRADR